MNLATALHPNLYILEGRYTVDDGGPTECGESPPAGPYLLETCKESTE